MSSKLLKYLLFYYTIINLFNVTLNSTLTCQKYRNIKIFLFSHNNVSSK